MWEGLLRETSARDSQHKFAFLRSSEMDPCPCCKNPWSRSTELFSLSCEACVADDGGVTGIDPSNLDLSVAPATDFYTHANGTWLANNPIPGEYPSWNTFVQLHDQNLPRLRGLLEALAPPAAGATADTIESKVRRLPWASLPAARGGATM